MRFWGKGSSKGDDKFDEDELTRYINKPDIRLSDLGIGKFTPLQYPWNPKNSPNMCQQINLTVDATGAEDVKGIYPHPNCTEFVFTKQ